MFYFRLLVLLAAFTLISCGDVALGFESYEPFTVDSVDAVFLLENNMDSIENFAEVYYRDSLLFTLEESYKIKETVPDTTLTIIWSTLYVRGSTGWPYVYYRELDGSGAVDTTVVDTIWPEDNNRYYIRGTKINEWY